MTEIERACFAGTTAHWVSSIELSGAGMVLKLHPSFEDEKAIAVSFSDVSRMRIDTSHGEGELCFPMGIIGFDSKALANEWWAFVLHTDMIELSFQARWPNIDRDSTFAQRSNC